MLIWTYFLVFIFAAIPFFEILVIIPVAIVGGLPTIPVIIFALLGNLLTLYILIAFVDQLKVLWPGRKKQASKDMNGDLDENNSVESDESAGHGTNHSIESEPISNNNSPDIELEKHPELQLANEPVRDELKVGETDAVNSENEHEVNFERPPENLQEKERNMNEEKVPDTLKNAGDKSNSRNKRGRQIWDKYGLPGLALVGPFVTGSHLAAFLALTFGATKRKATIWFTISLTIWALAAGILSHYGFTFFISDSDTDGFIMKMLNRND